MNNVFFMRLCRLILLLALQVTVFNNIHLFGFITPIMMGYMIACLHRGTQRIEALLWGFFAGLLYDMFNNTAGMAASACTLTAMIQPPLLNKMAPRDAEKNLTPAFSTLGFWHYVLYIFFLMAILHVSFLSLEAFSLANWQRTLLSMVGSTVFASLITVFMELFVRPKKR